MSRLKNVIKFPELAIKIALYNLCTQTRVQLHIQSSIQFKSPIKILSEQEIKLVTGNKNVHIRVMPTI